MYRNFNNKSAPFYLRTAPKIIPSRYPIKVLIKQIEDSKPGPSGRRKAELWFPAAVSENGVNCQF